jgi:two-component sensor histidine kinase
MADDTPIPPDVATNLAFAVIAASAPPLLLLDGDLTILAASESFCQTYRISPDDIRDFKVYELGPGWDRPQLQSLLKAIARGAAEISAYEMDLVREGDTRRLVIGARKLDYNGAESTRLIASVTEARIAEQLKNDLLREKAVLLQEVHHRVANSLQIIASLLLQTARNVQSDETRNHLHDAHHRVMSVAAVQNQLTATRTGEVELRDYLVELCESLGASMIDDHERLSLSVTAHSTVVTANVSVSLGLIVTELVINALKHAFPDRRAGRIYVDYQAHGPRWSLSVSDNGIGILHGAASAKPGLGTSIVEALARQLDARVDVADTHPGTMVSVVHPKTPALVFTRTAEQPV